MYRDSTKQVVHFDESDWKKIYSWQYWKNHEEHGLEKINV